MYPSTASTCLLDIDYWTCYITLRDLYLVSVYSVLIAYLKWLYTANLLTVIGAYFDSVHQLESPDYNFDERTMIAVQGRPLMECLSVEEPLTACGWCYGWDCNSKGHQRHMSLYHMGPWKEYKPSGIKWSAHWAKNNYIRMQNSKKK